MYKGKRNRKKARIRVKVRQKLKREVSTTSLVHHKSCPIFFSSFTLFSSKVQTKPENGNGIGTGTGTKNFSLHLIKRQRFFPFFLFMLHWTLDIGHWTLHLIHSIQNMDYGCTQNMKSTI